MNQTLNPGTKVYIPADYCFIGTVLSEGPKTGQVYVRWDEVGKENSYEWMDDVEYLEVLK